VSATIPRIGRAKLSQEVAEAIRWMIIDGSLPDGHRLTEESISEETGVSRGTVREAITQLASEGLVEAASYRGAVVSGISLEELAEVFIPVRWTLERFAIARALEKLGPAQLDHLSRIVDDMGTTAQSEDPTAIRRMVELDVDFHRTIIDAADSRQAQQLWQAIQPRVRLGFYRLGASQPHPSLIADEHGRLLELLRKGELGPVLVELEEHVVTSPLALLGLGESEPA